MRLPDPRGPISAGVLAALRAGRPENALANGSVAELRSAAAAAEIAVGVLDDEDLQLALAVCYQLHYTSFDGVDDGWEWDPGLLTVRGALERRFADAIGALVGRPRVEAGEAVGAGIRRLIAADDSPSLSTYLLKHASADQFRAYVQQRSVYQLIEADPHSWAIPRVDGATKVALIEIQADEYGGGRADRMHSLMYADMMRSLGLDATYGAYWNVATAQTFAALNLMSYFGLHRGRRGALLGHLAAYEMTSTTPCRRMANGLRRLGFDDQVCAYYDEHVLADAVHEQLAAVDLCGSFAAQHPEFAGDVLFGAAACLALEGRVGSVLLDRFALRSASTAA